MAAAATVTQFTRRRLQDKRVFNSFKAFDDSTPAALPDSEKYLVRKRVSDEI
jgi:hypothetical protein